MVGRCFCRKIAAVPWVSSIPMHGVHKLVHAIDLFSSFTQGNCKLATSSHPAQGHDGPAIPGDQPSNCKPSPNSGLCGGLLVIACHESRDYDPGRMYAHFSCHCQLMHASFNGMFVSYALPENREWQIQYFPDNAFKTKTIAEEQCVSAPLP